MAFKKEWLGLFLGFIFSCTTESAHQAGGDTVVNFENPLHFLSVEGEGLFQGNKRKRM